MTDMAHNQSMQSPSAPARTEPRPWGIYLMFGLFGAQQGMLGPLMPFLRAEFNLDLRWTGLHFAAYALGLVLIGVPYRWLEGRALAIGIGRIAIGSIVLASGLFSIAGGLTMTLPGSVLMGFSSGLVMAVGQAMLGRLYGRQAVWSAGCRQTGGSSHRGGPLCTGRRAVGGRRDSHRAVVAHGSAAGQQLGAGHVLPAADYS